MGLLKVKAVAGRKVLFRDEDGRLFMENYVGYDLQGQILPDGVKVPDTPYYWTALARDDLMALLEADFLPPSSSPEARKKLNGEK